jgi:hypothetical protein
MLGAFKPTGSLAVDMSRMGTGIRFYCNMEWHENPVIYGLRLDALIPRARGKCNPASLSWDRILIHSPAKEILQLGKQAEIISTGRSGAAADRADVTEPNTLYIGRGSLPLSACDTKIVFGPVSIPAGSGSLMIARGEVEYATGNIELRGVNLKDIEFEWNINDRHVKALLSGKNIRAEFKDGILRIHGTISTAVAGGKVEKSNIWTDFSGPVPRYGADIKFYGIDLATLTSLTGFGRITGRLDGHIRHLVISGSQPESFDLEIRSRKTSGVDQEISIKAIRSLSILGGGGGGIPLLGEFFKNFSYSKIAVSCSLKNDIFTMHGLIKKNGTEYLVERGFWGGVNVINQNPGGRIAFSDMLERLARISKSGKAEVK